MYLLFDTETNGLPKNYKGSPTDVDNWPRIIQLAFMLVDENFNEIEKFCHLIRPSGWEIPKEKFWIENGYSTEKNHAEGIDMAEALYLFTDAIQSANYLVAHNMDFDYPILCAEMIRSGITSGKKLQRICTMKSTTGFCGIAHANGKGIKWPKLEELHNKLFGIGFDGAHDALADVSATKRCLKELIKRDIIAI